MIRVLQVFGRLTRGGLETFVMNLYRNIDRSKIQFDFLVSAEGGDYEDDVLKMGASIYRLPARNKGIKKYNSALDEFFRQHASEYSAVHQHASSLSSIAPLKYAAKYGVPVRIIHAHSSAISHSVKAHSLHYLMHLWGKLHIKNYATHYMGCSDKALDWLFNGTGIRGKAVMINNGIKVSDFRYNIDIRERVRKEFSIVDEFVIGHVGNFIPVKNHSYLIRLFADYVKINPKSKLLLVGDGPLRTEIESQISDVGLKDKMIIAGVRKDVKDILQGMDIIVMPSIFEGLPVSLVEAQAAGLPLVISDTISHDVALTDNVHYLSLSESKDVWCNAIENIRKNYVRKDTSCIINEKGFGIEGIVDNLSKLYLSTK